MTEIQLRGKYRHLSATVDDEDMERLVQYNWWLHTYKHLLYARTYICDQSGKGRIVLMHRMIMEFPQKPFEVDHYDGNGLNNRRDNLRVVSRSENMRNARWHSDGRRKWLLAAGFDEDRWYR